MMKIKPISILLFLVLFASCGEYNKILKSSDRDVKYTYAKKYFQEGKIDDIAKYCMKDVVLTREVYYKMIVQNMPGAKREEDVF